MSKAKGSKKYTPIWNGLWDHKHAMQMGKAVFLYGELLSRSKGKPIVRVTYQELHDAMGSPIRTLENWMRCLKDGNYISIEGKNPMTVTINKYRLIKNGKIQSLPDTKTEDTNPQEVAVSNPPEMVGPNPQDLVGQENINPPDMVETSPNMVGPSPITPLKTVISKPSLKYKKKTQEGVCNSGDLKGSKKPSKSKESKPINPGVKILMDHYHNEFLRIHGSKPELSGSAGARAGKEFKDLLEANGRTVDDFKELITNYLSLRDSALQEAGYPIAGWFPNRINGLLLQKKQHEAEFVF